VGNNQLLAMDLIHRKTIYQCWPWMVGLLWLTLITEKHTCQ
jgi:hypothetical protein